MKILVINPGSTSTKLSIYEDDKELFTESVFHDAPVLCKFKHVNDQLEFREKVVYDFLSKHSISFTEIGAIACRGGSAYPQKSGVIKIDERLYDDTFKGVGGSEHAAKLGVMLGYKFSKEYRIPSYTLDATNVDELCDYARITGIRGVYRNAQSHVLNQKAVAKYYASSINKKYEDCNFIVCHIDGGITVSAHLKGKMVDGNVGSGGDGSFTPTRIGSVPVLPLLDYLENHSLSEVKEMCSRSGGFVSYFNTSNVDTIRELLDKGDLKAKLIWESMIYNIAKEIGAMACVLKGQVDGIILTGGFVRFTDLVAEIKEYCGFIGNIVVINDREQETLALEVYKVLKGKIEAREYTGEPVFKGFDFI